MGTPDSRCRHQKTVNAFGQSRRPSTSRTTRLPNAMLPLNGPATAIPPVKLDVAMVLASWRPTLFNPEVDDGYRL